MNDKDVGILNNLIKELGAMTSSRADRIYQANEGNKNRTHEYSVIEAQLANALKLQNTKETGMTSRNTYTEDGLTTRNSSDNLSKDYMADKNFQGIQDTNMTNEEIATISALAQKYQADQVAKAQMYNSDKVSETQMYGSDKSLEGVINTNEAQKYGADQSLKSVYNTNSANKYMADTQATSQNYISDNQLAGTEYQADAGVKVAEYGINAEIEKQKRLTDAAKAKEASNYINQFDINADHTIDAIDEDSDFYLAASDVSNGWEQDKNKILIDIQQLRELEVPRTDPRWQNIIEGLKKYKDIMSQEGYLDGGFNFDSGEMEKMNLQQVENMIKDLRN